MFVASMPDCLSWMTRSIGMSQRSGISALSVSKRYMGSAPFDIAFRFVDSSNRFAETTLQIRVKRIVRFTRSNKNGRSDVRFSQKPLGGGGIQRREDEGCRYPQYAPCIASQRVFDHKRGCDLSAHVGDE